VAERLRAVAPVAVADVVSGWRVPGTPAAGTRTGRFFALPDSLPSPPPDALVVYIGPESPTLTNLLLRHPDHRVHATRCAPHLRTHTHTHSLSLCMQVLGHMGAVGAGWVCWCLG
jgi:hypothetical protein